MCRFLAYLFSPHDKQRWQKGKTMTIATKNSRLTRASCRNIVWCWLRQVGFLEQNAKVRGSTARQISLKNLIKLNKTLSYIRKTHEKKFINSSRCGRYLSLHILQSIQFVNNYSFLTFKNPTKLLSKLLGFM